ncbi:ATP-binding cassette, subfamily F, member 3 [Desulfosarcina sp. BuS5]|nr:ATP-binding cassette, subfamily F, member 3 [Desulfosarcina sp. BuS5]
MGVQDFEPLHDYYIVINIENISKSFGGNALFKGISFRVNPRERVGIVGRNGHGKTTLFRLIIGEEDFDGGSITVTKNYRIGYVLQQLDFTEDSILAEGEKGLPEHERDQSWKVEKILTGLGFALNDLSRHPKEFSGGFQVRLNLAKALVSEPDLLLLDEPTNYLDITSIRWIERFLNNWPRELMLISHNRSFMDSVVTHIVGIHRKKVRKVAGNTEKYYQQIAQQEEIYEKTRINDEKRRKDVQIFINRFRAKARLANLVQSRIKSLNRMEKREKLEKQDDLEFSFRSLSFRSKYLMSADKISFAYDKEDFIIKNFNITIGAGDRICVVGQNGRGKTTLLKLLAGALRPDQGEIKYNPAASKGFFEQTNVKSLNDSFTVEEEILSSHRDVDRQMARNICGAMMFGGDAALKKIRVLSGGEKSRVMLGKLLAAPVNLLLLDEPTNHLDMESSDALLEAIDDFDGAVVMVTHNEMFLHALADRLIIFQNGSIDLFDGSYQSFLDKGGWGDNSTEKEASHSKGLPAKETGAQINKQKSRRERSGLLFKRSQVLKPLKQKIKKVEEEIERCEKQLDRLNLEIVDASHKHDGEKIAELSIGIHVCNSKIDSFYDELEELTDTLAEEEKEFGQFIDV